MTTNYIFSLKIFLIFFACSNVNFLGFSFRNFSGFVLKSLKYTFLIKSKNLSRCLPLKRYNTVFPLFFCCVIAPKTSFFNLSSSLYETTVQSYPATPFLYGNMCHRHRCDCGLCHGGGDGL